MVAITWSDDEEFGSEDDAESKKVTSFCLMVHDDEDRYPIQTNLKLFLMNYKMRLMN